MSCAFSVVYHDEGVTKAVDWSWPKRGRWTISVNENGISWDPAGLEVDGLAYWNLLVHFGLDMWAHEYPKERIIEMSPFELAASRRQKERELFLTALDIGNNTLGDCTPVERF